MSETKEFVSPGRQFFSQSALVKGLVLSVLALSAAAYAQKPCTSKTAAFDDGWSFHLGSDIDESTAAKDAQAAWAPVHLPHDWAIVGPRASTNPSGGQGAFAPMGVGWYRRHISTPQKGCPQRVMIRFDGVMAHSAVWINGHLLGQRPNGYVSFEYDLSPYLASGPGADNTLVVRTDNSAQPSSRFYQGAGIFRHVHLIYAPNVHTRPWSTVVRTSAISSDAAEITVGTVIVNSGDVTEASRLRVTVTEKGTGRLVAETAAKLPATPAGAITPWSGSLRIAHPKLWKLQQPNLYQAKLTVLSGHGNEDVESVTFGVRDAHFEAATGFWLNGTNLKIKGVALHDDFGAMGVVAPRSLMKHRLLAMRSMGANAIRLAHNPVDPAFLDLCDELGFLVLDEFFDVWTVGKNTYDYHLNFQDWYLRDLRDTVVRDRNHPSIIAWSAGNEIRDTPHPEIAKPILASMVAAYHELDPGRPVTQALFRPNVSHDYDNGLADLLDVVGQNYRPAEILAAHAQKHTRKILGTENIHDRATWLAVRDNAPYSGMFLWSGTDYLGESRKWPLFADASGAFDRTDFPKPDALEHESWWRTDPVIHVVRRTAPTPKAPTDPGYELQQYRPEPTVFHDWTPSDQNSHAEKVEVYSNCADVRLTLNGTDLGRQSLPADAAPRLWDVAFAPGTLSAECLDHPSTRETLRTAGKPYAIQVTDETHTHGSGLENISLIRATVVDQTGTAIPGVALPLDVSLSGPGRVVAEDDADTVYHQPFESNHRSTYDGRIVIYVERTGAGTLQLSLGGENLKQGSIMLPE